MFVGLIWFIERAPWVLHHRSRDSLGRNSFFGGDAANNLLLAEQRSCFKSENHPTLPKNPFKLLYLDARPSDIAAINREIKKRLQHINSFSAPATAPR